MAMMAQMSARGGIIIDRAMGELRLKEDWKIIFPGENPNDEKLNIVHIKLSQIQRLLQQQYLIAHFLPTYRN